VNPERQTLAQWQAFVDGLGVDTLIDEAVKANTAAFTNAMLEEGYSAEEVHACIVMFAKRFVTLGQVPPQGGYLDLGFHGQ
jgi:hypothetical protein